jgi:uncharacterized OsmC-like protein
LQGFGRAQGAGHVGVQAGGHVAGADQAGFGLVGLVVAGLAGCFGIQIPWMRTMHSWG